MGLLDFFSRKKDAPIAEQAVSEKQLAELKSVQSELEALALRMSAGSAIDSEIERAKMRNIAALRKEGSGL